ncbi:competence/damage-inducible protein A [Salinarchaeum sp. IM2453]|uniref:competence/damage-inducible protein A n=1 Tax=Salinarchaeum sp. IM2453 TaxID=2862870 RepID=UPI001C83F33A|nr:molybdopterin-binding protein [Salinarchaeum sp. IM2453]QZA87992.1 competence/damage-inducible protein A [Salinarchaeum sp. IM2453]
MNAAVVTVGDELLTGDTVNTNATWLCTELTDRGVSVRRTVVVPDNLAEIAQTVNEYRAKYDAVIVTGGLGPTHDDVTMEAVATAFGRTLVEDEEAAEWLCEHGYAAEDLIEGTAQLPEEARPLHNEVGVAPGAAIGSVYVLPGVPSEMKAMFNNIADEFGGEKPITEFIVANEPESELIGRMEQLQEQYDVKVGSYPGENVRIKITGSDETTVQEAATWLKEKVTLADPQSQS